MNKSGTAHETWNDTWNAAEGRAEWLTPAADVIACAEAVHSTGGRRALDLGCGVGRHALALAQLGFTVDAVDGSANGLAFLKQEADRAGLSVGLHRGLMHELNFDADIFDYVLAFNVIYHGDPALIAQTVEGIARVIKPGGTLQLTMLSKRNVLYGKGEEIAPSTFVIPDGDGDKIHPHFYCNAGELVSLLDGFELRSLIDRDDGDGHWHWHVIANRA